MKWFFLIFAIVFEVAGTVSMKLSDGLRKPIYSVSLFVFYFGSLAFLTVALKHFEISVVYAIWSGLGVAVISIIGIIFFDEKLDSMKVISLLLVFFGVVGLNLTKK
jgi:small multidrug resistance pump